MQKIPRLTFTGVGNKPETSGRFINSARGFVLSLTRNSLVSHCIRPIDSANYEVTPRVASDDERVTAVVIQGPLQTGDNFTLETVKIYKKIFPLSPIIVSTWSSESKKNLYALECAGAVLNISDRPINAGWGNIELQVLSTISGLRCAQELGCEYVAKTRGDWRMYRPSALQCLNSLLQMYPPPANGKQENRIVASSTSTLKHRIYGLTDIFQYGSIADMMMYWEDLNHDIQGKFRNTEVPEIINGVPLVAEIYLCARYLEMIGIDLDFSLTQWWESLRNNFIVVDNAMLDAVWNKYGKKFENRDTNSYRLRGPLAIDHLDWLRLLNSDVSDWQDNGFQERWVKGEVSGMPYSNGISQISV
ncbi:MAG: WavE lipopolysaccharide synthesis family protein [Gammaproteobacteria bacterium]